MLLCFVVGGLLAPLVHQIQHGLDAFTDVRHGEIHERPDFEVISDNSAPVEQKELACTLCSFVFFSSLETGAIASHPYTERTFLDRVTEYNSVFSLSILIRGPPSVC